MEFHRPTEHTLELMVQEEEKIRTSQRYNTLCTSAKNECNGWLHITKQIQLEVANKFGYFDNEALVAINDLNRARYDYPNNPIFRTPLYVRYNRSRKGEYNVGDFVPNIQLHNRCGDNIMLHDILDDRISVIIGGSHT